MTPEQFYFWFKGFADVSQSIPSVIEWENIKNELKKVETNKSVLPVLNPKDNKQYDWPNQLDWVKPNWAQPWNPNKPYEVTCSLDNSDKL